MPRPRHYGRAQHLATPHADGHPPTPDEIADVVPRGVLTKDH